MLYGELLRCITHTGLSIDRGVPEEGFESQSFQDDLDISRNCKISFEADGSLGVQSYSSTTARCWDYD